jgi:hypothetical protein
VTPIDRVDRQVLEVVLKVAEGDLSLDSDDQWPGDSC